METTRTIKVTHRSAKVSIPSELYAWKTAYSLFNRWLKTSACSRRGFFTLQEEVDRE